MESSMTLWHAWSVALDNLCFTVKDLPLELPTMD